MGSGDPSSGKTYKSNSAAIFAAMSHPWSLISVIISLTLILNCIKYVIVSELTFLFGLANVVDLVLYSVGLHKGCVEDC